MREGLRFYADDADYVNDDEKSVYQSKVGSLTYGMQGTRPDIAYAASLFSRFLGKPTKSHVKALQGVFRYLTKTLDLGIVYDKHDSKGLHAYTDADWAGSTLIGDSKSTSGYVVMLAGGPIAWSSRRQTSCNLFHVLGIRRSSEHDQASLSPHSTPRRVESLPKPSCENLR